MAATRLPADTPLTPDELAAIRKPFRSATLLPGRVFHDPAVLAWEVEHFFARDWLVVGRAEEVPETGSSSSSTSRARTSSSCGDATASCAPSSMSAGTGGRRSRGAGVREGVRFQCPYHAWIYDLDGRLVRAKHLEGLEDFSFATTASPRSAARSGRGGSSSASPTRRRHPTCAPSWATGSTTTPVRARHVHPAAGGAPDLRGRRQLEDHGGELLGVLPLPGGPPAPQPAHALRPGRGLSGPTGPGRAAGWCSPTATTRCRSTAGGRAGRCSRPRRARGAEGSSTTSSGRT